MGNGVRSIGLIFTDRALVRRKLNRFRDCSAELLSLFLDPLVTGFLLFFLNSRQQNFCIQSIEARNLCDQSAGFFLGVRVFDNQPTRLGLTLTHGTNMKAWLG